MKIMIASDIHGSAYFCRLLLDRFEAEGADRLLLLGDLLYHGPRNDLPRDYAPKQVIQMLNGYKDRIACVRGNCDTEVDQMVLEFPILADYILLSSGDKTILATHGHCYNTVTPPPMAGCDVLLHGHTHVPVRVAAEGYTYINPGSVSIPKEGSHHGYMTLCDGEFVFKDLEDGSVVDIA